MMISYGCVYKRSSKLVMKVSRVETIEAARKIYAVIRRRMEESKYLQKLLLEASSKILEPPLEPLSHVRM